MSNKDFSGVADTLFIPLAARVYISQRFPQYFCDKKALELADLEQVKKINAKANEYSSIASAARYYNTDRFAQDFLNHNNGGNIINLGAGLESVNYRISHPNAHFYSVDFPQVIADRKTVLGIAENETQIGCDITDMAWAAKVDRSKPSMLMLSGVLQYFKPEAVSKFIADLKGYFPGSILVFDATNEVGIRYAQKYVKKTGNMDAMMYFYINDPVKFAADNHVELLEVRGFYDVARKTIGKKMGLYARIAMKVADEKKRTLLLRIKL